MRFVLALFAIVVAVPAASAPADAIADAFVDVLRRDDPRLLAALLHPSTRPEDVVNLRELVDVYDCTWVDELAVHDVSSSDDAISFNLTIHGGASAKADWRPQVSLPRRWRIEAHRDGEAWKLTRAETEERTMAAAMLAAPTAAEADALLASASAALDRGRIILEYALLAPTRGRERVDHLRALLAATDDVHLQVELRRQIAVIFVRQPQSVEEAAQAVALADAQGTPDDRAGALLTLGTTTYILGDFAGAQDIYARAVALVELCDDPIPALKALHMRGFMSLLLHDNAGELQHVDRLTELATHYGWLEGEEVSALRRGTILALLGHLEMARATYEAARRIGIRNGNLQYVGITLHSIAALDATAGHYRTAIELYRQALAIESPLPAWRMIMRVSLAQAYYDVGDFARAEEVVREAEAAFDGSEDPQMKTACAKILLVKAQLLLARGQLEAVPESAAAALRQAGDDWWDKGAVSRARTLSGRALRRMGRRNEAEAELRAALEAVDEWITPADEIQLPPRLQEPRLDPYAELTELLVEEGRLEDALLVAEQMKARSLRAELAHGRIDLSASMTAGEKAKEKALEERIVQQNRDLLRAMNHGQPVEAVHEALAVTRAERDAFVAEMRLRYRAVERRRIAPERSIALPPMAEPFALVEYVVGETQTTVFVLADGQIHAERIAIARKELERAANEVALRIGSRSERWGDAAAALYRSLFAPVERWTRGATVLCIVPDRALWSVPFHALLDGRGAPLIDRHTIFYAHSLTLLRTAWSAHSEAASRLIAFGNPEVGTAARAGRAQLRDVAIGPLPDAEAEVRSLASLYPASRIYVRDAAREATFKREVSQFGIVHLAAHALVDTVAPMYSAIVLAGGGEPSEDGFLEAREIADSALSARLVVLSACDTARGRVGAGEGVLGLAWAFFAAGAPTTVVSQWKAESRSTSRLMVLFHERLAAGASPAAALRDAQLALRRTPRYAHPFYWAPFVAVGAAGRGLFQ